MRSPGIDDFVLLTRDVPELCLFRGARGVVRSMWFAPTEAYEVEFTPEGLGAQMRAMLLADQIQVDEESRFNPAGVNQPVH